MFVAFLGNPSPWIYIPTKVYTSICSIFIKIILNILSKKLCPHRARKNFASHEWKWFCSNIWGCLYINLHYMYCKLQNISIFHCIRNFNWVKWLKGSSLEHTWPDWILRGVFMIISFCWILFRGGKGRVSFTINVSLWILSKY